MAGVVPCVWWKGSAGLLRRGLFVLSERCPVARALLLGGFPKVWQGRLGRVLPGRLRGVRRLVFRWMERWWLSVCDRLREYHLPAAGKYLVVVIRIRVNVLVAALSCDAAQAGRYRRYRGAQILVPTAALAQASVRAGTVLTVPVQYNDASTVVLFVA